MAGAVLVQNTAWRNAAAAVGALREAGLLGPEDMAALAAERLSGLIRSSGYHRVKARRLLSLCNWLNRRGGIAALRGRRTCRLREELLDVHGIGPETADAILLYALGRPVFVADAYAFRIFGRTGFWSGPADYESLRAAVEQCLPDTEQLNELHALLVAHARQHCRVQPRCADCPLRGMCRYARRGASA
jgi:endonuclease-3 related protein